MHVCAAKAASGDCIEYASVCPYVCMHVLHRCATLGTAGQQQQQLWTCLSVNSLQSGTLNGETLQVRDCSILQAMRCL